MGKSSFSGGSYSGASNVPSNFHPIQSIHRVISEVAGHRLAKQKLDLDNRKLADKGLQRHHQMTMLDKKIDNQRTSEKAKKNLQTQKGRQQLKLANINTNNIERQSRAKEFSATENKEGKIYRNNPDKWESFKGR